MHNAGSWGLRKVLYRVFPQRRGGAGRHGPLPAAGSSQAHASAVAAVGSAIASQARTAVLTLKTAITASVYQTNPSMLDAMTSEKSCFSERSKVTSQNFERMKVSMPKRSNVARASFKPTPNFPMSPG